MSGNITLNVVSILAHAMHDGTCQKVAQTGDASNGVTGHLGIRATSYSDMSDLVI